MTDNATLSNSPIPPTVMTDSPHPEPEPPMSTTLAPSPRPTVSTARTADMAPAKVSTWRVIRSEWIKFWSVRSTSFTLLSAGIATILFGMIFSWATGSGDAAPGPAALLTDPVDLALAGTEITEMMVGILGVLFVAGEYSTGLVRTAFAAAGRRTRVIVSKATVVASTVFAMSAVAVTAAVILGQAVYTGDGITVAATEVLDVTFGTMVYLTGVALMGVALGFILRSTASGIATLLGGVLIGPNLLNLLPDSVTDVFMKYLPSEAGAAMMTQVSDPDLLNTGPAYAVFIAWVVGLLVLADVMVRRRDA